MKLNFHNIGPGLAVLGQALGNMAQQQKDANYRNIIKDSGDELAQSMGFHAPAAAPSSSPGLANAGAGANLPDAAQGVAPQLDSLSLYATHIAPKVVQRLLAAGDIDHALAFQQFAQQQNNHAYADAWTKAGGALASGDHQAALQHLVNLHALSDGQGLRLEGRLDGEAVGPDGQKHQQYTTRYYGPDGSLHHEHTGNLDDTAKLALYMLSPEKRVEMQYREQLARDKAQAGAWQSNGKYGRINVLTGERVGGGGAGSARTGGAGGAGTVSGKNGSTAMAGALQRAPTIAPDGEDERSAAQEAANKPPEQPDMGSMIGAGLRDLVSGLRGIDGPGDEAQNVALPPTKTPLNAGKSGKGAPVVVIPKGAKKADFSKYYK